MSVEKIVLCFVWREATYLFSDIEQLPSHGREEVTRVSGTHASDEAYSAALSVFGEKIWLNLPLLLPP
jgi:hypothetical protein